MAAPGEVAEGDVVLATSGLTKYYGEQVGALDVSLEVRRGEVFGFLGPNGAGKSTTIRMLLDFIRPTSGSATLLGLDAHRDRVALHRRLGFLSSDVGFYGRLTVAEHLRWIGRLRGGIDEDRLAALADRYGLDLGRTVEDLSTGNRQKVGLVQAFVHEPELLVLDEPTTGLDPLVQRTFQHHVRELADAGVTVFLSSHVLDEVEHTCDRVGIIRRGRVAAVESVGDLRRRAVRRVVITFASAPDPAPYRALAGASRVGVDGSRLHLEWTGPADALVKALARHEVLDLVSAPADLEAVFLRYYEGDDGDGAAPAEGGECPEGDR